VITALPTIRPGVNPRWFADGSSRIDCGKQGPPKCVDRLRWGNDWLDIGIEQGLSRLRLRDLANGVAGLDGADAGPVAMGVEPDQAIGAIRRELPALLLSGTPLTPATAVHIVLDPPLPDIDVTVRCSPPHGSEGGIVHPERPGFVVADQRIAGENGLNLVSGKGMRLERRGVVARVVIAAARGESDEQRKGRQPTLHSNPRFKWSLQETR
jgi:hypothetical protein